MQKVTISPTGANFDYADRETNPFYSEWAGFVHQDDEIRSRVVLRIYKNPKKCEKCSAWLYVWGGKGKYVNLHNVSSCTVTGDKNAEIICLNQVFKLCGIELEKPIKEFLSLHTQLQDILSAILSELSPDCKQYIHNAHG